MKYSKLSPRFFLAGIIMLLQFTCAAQDAATIADAKNYYNLGLGAYNKGNYATAIQNCLISIGELPNSYTYYILAGAYAKTGDATAALHYAGFALAKKPPLPQIKINTLNEITGWAYKVLTPANVQKATATSTTEDNDETANFVSEAITSSGEPSFPIPAPLPDETPFSEAEASPAAPNTTFNRQIFFYPNQAQCKDPIYNTANAIVGYVQFYGFTNGRNESNGKSTATSFSIGLSSVPDEANITAAMSTQWLNFTASELKAGSVKTKTIGMLTFKATILAVNKASAERYYMRSVKILVNVYPRQLMQMHFRRNGG